ncbi:MAG TPA: glycosyl hydrolase family 2, partial [Acidobacteriaceae bacterium]
MILLAAPLMRAQQASGPLLRLHEGWWLASGCGLSTSGAQLSSASYQADRQTWKAIAVPTTVLAAQVGAGEFGDPYFARNLRSIPGTDYPVGKI